MNRYYGLRHGQSEANLSGLVVSHPDNGVGGYGLTDHGRWQATVAGRQRLGRPVVLSSDFRRARETAEIVALSWGVTIELDQRLRERGFGERELSHEPYEPVWAADAVDGEHRRWGVESTVGVAGRIRDLHAECERRWDDHDIVWVSHGDTLQIARAVLRDLPTGHHYNQMIPWANAELLPLDR